MIRCLNELGILINQPLTNNQFIQLFSNPVSGIACESPYIDRMELPARERLWRIRYSKSMMLGALKFWIEQYCVLYLKLRRIDKPFLKISDNISALIQELIRRESIVKKCPDSFLFSHRYITPRSGGYPASIDNQLKLLNKKYDQYQVYGVTKTLDPYFKIDIKNLGIQFTVFPNEHPYIPRQKISKIGMTDRGNIYILHRKKVGA